MGTRYAVLLILIFLVLLPSCAQNTDCSSAKNKFGCYESYYEKTAGKSGVIAAISDLKQNYPNDEYIKTQCHQLMHVMGRIAAKEYANISNAFSQGDSFCWSGYYHGVMEEMVSEIGSADLPKKINSVCDDIPGKKNYTFGYYNCVHGLGHGVMYVNDHELFDSLEVCDNLNGSYEQRSCWSGVFMENVITDFKNHRTEYLKPDDPLYPCSAVNAKYKQTCYLMQTSYMLKVTAGNFSKVFELCSMAENPYADSCYQSLGRDASGNSLSDPEMTKQICLLGKGYMQQSNCVAGAVKDFISYFHSNKQAKEFCSILAAELKKFCFETAESYYKNFY